MTSAEQATLDAMRREMNESFREIRGVVERAQKINMDRAEEHEDRISALESSRFGAGLLMDAIKWGAGFAVAVAAVAVALASHL